MNEPVPSTSANAETPTDVRVFFGTVSLIAIGTIGFAAWLLARNSPEPADASPMVEEQRLLDFALTERSGRTITRTDLAGQNLVVNFVHTSCSITCFQVNQRMSKLQERLAGREDVRLVSITVDPQTDTPQVLAKFAERFNADANRWLFLTGPQAAVDDLVEGSFYQRPPGAPRSALFAATDRIWLVDATGRVCQRFNGLKTSAPDAVLNALAQLQEQARLP
jgi:cytochrome oxidase Cu insertion factor (SCO1/SenC/PrrC family)